MQLKFLSLFFTVLLVVSTSVAQRRTKVTMIPLSSPSEVLKPDSVITISGPRTPGANSPIALNNSGISVSKFGKQYDKVIHDDSVLPYRHVPLAGEVPYFGEKTDFVTDFVRRYMEKNNQTLSYVQNRSATPFSIIDNILEEKQMPKELKYLAVIESALNHDAVSHAGAVGPWQLMAATAKMLGLSVTHKKDERKDWNKSTIAATKYLDLLYSQLNDWLLVIAAYNCGPTPVLNALAETGSHSFWEIKEYLPKETQGHVLAFIATASIFENLSKFIDLGSVPMDFNISKFKEEELPPPPVVEIPKKAYVVSDTRKPMLTEEEKKNMVIVQINEPLNVDLIVQELSIDKKTFQKLNQDYENYVLKKTGTTAYNLHLPKDKIDLYLLKKNILIKKSRLYFQQNQM